MIRLGAREGKSRLGLIIFVFLAGLVVGQFTYRYLTRVNRINDEAVELMNQGKYDSALEKLEEALAEDPDHYLANYHRGLCLAEKHRWEEAIGSFTRATILKPTDAKPLFHHGQVLWKLGRFDEAIPVLQKAVERKTPFAEAWVILAESYYEEYLGAVAKEQQPRPSPEQAKAAFKTYLKQRPDAPDRQTVELKLQILSHVERYPEVLQKRRDKGS